MPELPEVEHVRMQLRHKVVGKTIDSVEIFHNKTVAFDESVEDRLINKTIEDIDRIGKLMIFSFENENDLFLLAHLKMIYRLDILGSRFILPIILPYTTMICVCLVIPNLRLLLK